MLSQRLHLHDYPIKTYTEQKSQKHQPNNDRSQMPPARKMLPAKNEFLEWGCIHEPVLAHKLLLFSEQWRCILRWTSSAVLPVISLSGYIGTSQLQVKLVFHNNKLIQWASMELSSLRTWAGKRRTLYSLSFAVLVLIVAMASVLSCYLLVLRRNASLR